MAVAQEQAPAAKSEDSLEKDYGDELPRIDPLEPEEAMKSFHLKPGFEIQQVATEPQVVDPVAMAFDEDGRLYVVEMRDYSEDDELHLGRIRLLEDRDGDGWFETSTVFADDLSWPTALAVYDGGVFVGAAPDIYYLKDTNGDGKADERRVVFTGFAKSNVQGLLNSFQWGLDQRIHGATSSSGGDVTRPDVPDQPAIALRGRDFSFDPKTLELRPESGGAQHGMSFDSWGRKFVCSNSDHIQLVMYEERYAGRNPYAVAPSPRVSIASDGPQADVYRTSPVEPWRIVRTRLRAQGIVPGVVEGGGRAAGYFTSATGVTIYEGDAWPEEFRGYAIIGDVGGNLIHRKRLERKSVGLVAHRVDEKSEFATSDDIWFRPVQFLLGPDGSLYVLDMYRETIEHPASLHPIIKKHLDLTSGRDRGRIYRIVPEGFQYRAAPKLSEASDEELVALLDHPNYWHRTTASRLLTERGAERSEAALRRLVTEGKRYEGRILGLYMLDSVNRLTSDLLLAALKDPDAPVRIHAVRLSERLLPEDSALLQALVSMVDDPDQNVRYQLAFSLGATTGELRNAALAAIAVRDGADPYVRFAIHSSLEQGAGDVLARFAQNAEAVKQPWGRSFIETLATQIGRQERPEDVAVVLRLLQGSTSQQAVEALLTGLAPKKGSALERQVSAVAGGKAGEILQGMLAEAREVATDLEAKTPARVEAILLLQLGRLDDQKDVLAQLLYPDQPVEVQEAALRTYASFEDPEVADIILETWPTMGPQLRSSAGELLATRPNWLVRLLDAVEQKQIPAAELSPTLRQSLTAHPDAELRERSQKLLAGTNEERSEILKQYQVALEMQGDAIRGKEVFKRACASCHQVQGMGHAIGPNLAAMKNRGPEAILSNVILPNAEVNPQYLTYAVTTKDGRTLSGMIAEESAASITLQKAENVRDTVLRIDIEELRSTGLSLMPEGIEKDITPEAMADLLAYLQTIE